MDLGQKQGLGAPCLKCKENCAGFEPHFWKKICLNCKCGQEEHDILLSSEEDQKVGRLLKDSNLTTKLKSVATPKYKCSETSCCAGCGGLIFSNEYTQAENKNWHLKHFCCSECNNILAGKIYVMVSGKPVCKPCYMKKHAVLCQGCHNSIDPEEQRVMYNNFSWHASTKCFLCSCCSKCLIRQKFIPEEGMVFCSMECKKMMS